MRDGSFLATTRHPLYTQDEMYWYDWRMTYDGGPEYVRRNLKRFSNRETPADFDDRAFYTPIPAYAKAAINDIRNSIFQRLRDVSRTGGSEKYRKASAGEIGGVDNKGSAMQSFFGIEVLTELLVMGRVGVYVDMPKLAGFHTMADEGKARPYVYKYPVEDILSWTAARPEEPGDFTSVLLRDFGIDYNQGFGKGVFLPGGSYLRYRLIWIDPDTKKVKMKFFNEDEEVISPFGERAVGEGVIDLDLDRIPFTMMDIGGSLLKDVYKHQVALLNLGSADVSYALKANFPFYTEQKDMRAVGSHLKKTVSDDGTTGTSDNHKPGEEGRVGITHGRVYDLKTDRPKFINPSPEPLMASIKLQEKLEDDIRKLVNLAVQNKMGQRAISAEAMKLSDQGLEAGLSYIGLVLQGAERRVAEHWAAYESRDASRRKVAIVKYPDRYSLKNDEDRIKEAQDLASLIYTVPGKAVKKELARNIVTTLLSGKISTDQLDTIFKEIENSNYTTSDPEIIIRAQEAGLVGEKTASMALGFGPDEHLRAQEDHMNRAARVADAQAQATLKMQAAQGGNGLAIRDQGINPQDNKLARKGAASPILNPEKKKAQRGAGKKIKRGP